MAHKSVYCDQHVSLITGSPGTGYETLGRALPARWNYEKMDGIGRRSDPFFEDEWYIDPIYVWSKAMQASEDGKTRVWSIGGQNWWELLALRWPCVIVLKPLPVSEWVRRANEFRAKVGLPPLPSFARDRYCSTAARAMAYVEKMRRYPGGDRICVLDARNKPEYLASQAEHFLAKFALDVLAPSSQRLESSRPVGKGDSTAGAAEPEVRYAIYAQKRDKLAVVESGLTYEQVKTRLSKLPPEAAHDLRIVEMGTTLDF